jgi:hypothetical protein
MKKISARVVGAASLGIAILATPAVAADRDLLAASAAPRSVADASASADVVVANGPNCLLPGRIRSFGGITMLTPRHPVTLDAAACAARGGEPIDGTSVAAE